VRVRLKIDRDNGPVQDSALYFGRNRNTVDRKEDPATPALRRGPDFHDSRIKPRFTVSNRSGDLLVTVRSSPSQVRIASSEAPVIHGPKREHPESGDVLGARDPIAGTTYPVDGSLLTDKLRGELIEMRVSCAKIPEPQRPEGSDLPQVESAHLRRRQSRSAASPPPITRPGSAYF